MKNLSSEAFNALSPRIIAADVIWIHANSPYSCVRLSKTYVKAKTTIFLALVLQIILNCQYKSLLHRFLAVQFFLLNC
jgi:hypothetical protein